MTNLLFGFFMFGLTLGSGSCLAGCGPLLISYLAGTEKNIRNSIRAYGLFSLSRLCVYLVLGISVYFLGQFLIARFLNLIARPVYITGGLIIALIGFFLIIDKNPDSLFCAKVRGFFFRKDAKNIIAFGVIMGIVPCAALLSVLVSIALTATTLMAALMFILAFGLGTIVSPLFILAVYTGFIPRIAPRKRLLGILSGGIVVFTGIQLILKGL
ncbi:MAG: sulfite exporter TauE/SafE family protein [Candidatus Omnitrophica bacterium]|nr:sulfite exporter TauE/SafE family protein [Candidatus Omnitrophota bacterium]